MTVQCSELHSAVTLNNFHDRFCCSAYPPSICHLTRKVSIRNGCTLHLSPLCCPIIFLIYFCWKTSLPWLLLYVAIKLHTVVKMPFNIVQWVPCFSPLPFSLALLFLANPCTKIQLAGMGIYLSVSIGSSTKNLFYCTLCLKKRPTFDLLWLTWFDDNNFWHKCYWESRQSKCTLFSHVTLNKCRCYQTNHRWQFFFQEDSRVHATQSNCCSLSTNTAFVWKLWFSCLPVLPDSAEAQVIQGGILKHLLTAYFISNITAKKYQNLFMCGKVIASHRWDVFFWDTVYFEIKMMSSI